MATTWRDWNLDQIAQTMANIFTYSRASSVTLDDGWLSGGRVASFMGTKITIDIGEMNRTFDRLRGVTANDFAYLVVADEVAGMTLRDDGAASTYNFNQFEAAVNLIALAATSITSGPLFESGLERARRSDQTGTNNALLGATMSSNARLARFGQMATGYYQRALGG